MTENEPNEDIHENQFLDPPIKPQDRSDEPEYAPSIDTHNSLEADATKEEIEHSDFTEVTHLYLDRTPED